jgi:hypothetical protein
MSALISQLQNLFLGLTVLVMGVTPTLPLTSSTVTTTTSPNGLYIVASTLSSTSALAKTQIQALQDPNVTGIVILLNWYQLQPTYSTYDWSQLDYWATQAVKSGKKISFGMKAGSSSPLWLKTQYNVPYVTINENQGSTSTPKCVQMLVPVPWNAQFKYYYNKAMTSVASHLKSLSVSGYKTGAAYDAVTFVKVTGVNMTTAELTLGNTQPEDASCPNPKINDAWHAVSYGPMNVSSAWGQMATNTSIAFPDKIFALNIIQKSIAFPPIDKYGNPITIPDSAAFDPVTDSIISLGLNNYPKRFSVQWNALSTPDANPTIMTNIKKLKTDRGSIIGWQTNSGATNTAAECGAQANNTRHACTSTEYLSLLNNGIDMGGQFIEIFANDAVRFASVLQGPADRLRK